MGDCFNKKRIGVDLDLYDKYAVLSLSNYFNNYDLENDINKTDQGIKYDFDDIGNGRISFHLNTSSGDKAWSINTSYYSGAPTLQLAQEEDKDRIIVRLVDSKFPGTDLSADFVCIITPMDESSSVHTISFRMTKLGVKFDTVLEQWIMNSVTDFTFEPTDSLDSIRICSFHNRGGEFLFTGKRGNGKITTDWGFQFFGDKLAKLQEINVELEDSDKINLVLNSFDLKLIEPENNTSLSNITRRTAFRIHRQSTDNWLFKPYPSDLRVGKLINVQENLFDRIYIDLADSPPLLPNDLIHQIFFAESLTPDKISFRFSGKIKDVNTDDQDFKIGLNRFGYTFDFVSGEKRIVSHFPDRFWFAIGNYAIEIGDSAVNYPLSVTFKQDLTSGRVDNMSKLEIDCSPTLIQAVLPFKDNENVIVQATRFENARISFVEHISNQKKENQVAFSNSDFLGLGNSFLYLHDFEVPLLRKEDLLTLRIKFANLALKCSLTESIIERYDESFQSHMIVSFPPQNVSEIVVRSDEPIPDEFPYPSRSSGESRLSFIITEPIQYSVKSILDWNRYRPSLNKISDYDDDEIPDSTETFPEKPIESETDLEIPWRLHISPNKMSGWVHRYKIESSNAFTAGELGITKSFELWHTRLAIKESTTGGEIKVIEDEHPLKRIRALWSPDYTESTFVDPPTGYTTTLDSNDRDQIVKRSSKSKMGEFPKTKPVMVKNLMLSSLGSWFDVKGIWDLDSRLTLIKWIHQSTMGRDHYVEIVHSGRLCPSGHRAVLTKISQRVFKNILSNIDPQLKNESTAIIQQTFYICTPDPVVDYADLSEEDFRNMEQNFVFKKLATEKGCIKIDPPPAFVQNNISSEVIETDKYFFPRVNGKEILFRLRGSDHDNKESEYVLPMMFIMDGYDDSGIAHYKDSDIKLRKANLYGQYVAFAPSGSEGDTRYPTNSLTFSVRNVGTVTSETSLRFYPILDNSNPDGSAEIMLSQVDQLHNNRAGFIFGGQNSIPIRFFENYSRNGFNGKDDLFLEMVNNVPVSFKEDVSRSGGVVTPDLSVKGLSREFGTVSGNLDEFVNGFNPTEYFDDAKMLGCIKLKEIIQRIEYSEPDFKDRIPKIKKIVTERKITSIMNWNPRLSPNWSAGIAEIRFHDPNDTLHLSIEITSGLQTDTTVNLNGSIKNFTLDIKDILEVTIVKVEFSKHTKSKMTVNAEIGEIKFKGPLNFVDELKKQIPILGFKNGPRINITTKSVDVGYSLPLPPVAFGAFAMDNIRLISTLKLPFTGGELNYEFAFSDKADPFLVTVSMLGGGGSFMFRMNLREITFFSAQVEFGACSAISFGSVASGTLLIMGGVYLEKDPASKGVPFAGYIRAKGELEVMGLVTASVEFYMGLKFNEKVDVYEIVGTATVSVEIDTLCFSKDVKLTYERRYENKKNGLVGIEDSSEVDNHFRLLMGLDDWKRYCRAFIPLMEVLN
ncbi:MAG: hypothetical protein AB7V56_12495 [Candidatus Nitrosocosmicus sp.]